MKYWTAFKNWTRTTAILRPVRAMLIAYGYVLRGEKVTTPMKWSDI